MNQKLLYAFLLLFITTGLFSQKKYTISGYIQAAASGEKMISANVFDVRSAKGAVTNTYGFYSLTLPKDTVELTFSYIGFQPQTKTFYLNKDTEFVVKLEPSVELAEIEIIGERIERIEESSQMSRVDVPIEQIKKLPALLGEVDVLKTLQLLPGVQSGGEGQSGLYVRGGSPDQNLVLLDGVPVYNVSHLLGIFSVFNADAIKNVTLTKGGFPARFGGRLSSVLEINMKEGNLEEYHGEGSIGLISSKFSVEGPIIKGKTSFLLSARRTYADVIFRPFIKVAGRAEGLDLKFDAHFHDINAKVQHKFNNKHRLFASFYSGKDIFFNEVKEDFDTFGVGIDWGNTISALRWNYQINNKLFANTTLTYSNYDFSFFGSSEFDDGSNEVESFSAKYLSGINDIGAKVDFDYIPAPNHYIRFGANATNHVYSPGALALKGSDGGAFSLDTLIGSKESHSIEYALYVEDDISWGALKANVGLHASAFSTGGKFYTSLQPRLGLRYLMSNNLAIKASYASMAQYLNLLTVEGFSLPSDLWVPSTAKIKPQQSWQTAFGLARTFNDKFEVSVEGFYKKMKNVVAYKEGASFLFGLENDWEDKVTQGNGEAYGLEFFLQKKKGKTTGWIGYTLSWNNRQFDEINGGKEYPYRYDRRHDISVVVVHDITDNISVSGAWVYGTGNAITLSTFRYPSQNNGGQFYGGDIESGGQKNAFRMSDYHRLDLSIEWRKQTKYWERKWSLSIYNAYNHNNPYYMIVSNSYSGISQQNTRKFKEVSILPIIPSISYGIKF